VKITVAFTFLEVVSFWHCDRSLIRNLTFVW